jgi:predicted amidophosphoribosyltransferase
MRPLLRAAGGANPQAGAGRRQRLRRGGVGVEPRTRVPDRVVLVDDVHTTGATLDACARALRAAGAHTVVAVIYARTLG